MPSYMIFKHRGNPNTSLDLHLMQILRDAPRASLSMCMPTIDMWSLEIPDEDDHLLDKYKALPALGIWKVEEGDESDAGSEDDNDNDLPDEEAQDLPPRASAPADPTKPSLLTLPPEMRNRIYRFTLVDDVQPIPMPAAATESWPAEPALLQTCSQIRFEASSIYYKENKFSIHIANNDAARYIKRCKSSPARRNSEHGLVLDGAANWANLEGWVQAWWRCECDLPIPAPEQEGQGEGLHWVVRLVVKLGGYDAEMPWETVKGMIGEVRGALGEADERWMA